jgi:hypothetical protein
MYDFPVLFKNVLVVKIIEWVEDRRDDATKRNPFESKSGDS